MSLNWDDETEEELTIAETKKQDVSPQRPTPPKGDETVAFVKKADLVRPKPRKPTWAEMTPVASRSPFFAQRYPLHAALPRDRFAAFLVDTAIFFYVNFVVGFFLKKFVFSLPFFSASSHALQWGIRFSVLALFILAYYVFFESVAGATPGKFLCRLRVVDLEGNVPTLANVFLRNLCRLFDYPLFLLVALISMESSPFYQSLGDRAGHTVVIKKTRKRMAPVDLRSTPLCSTLVRGLAFAIDLIFYLSLLWLYTSSMNPEKPKALFLLFWTFPLLALSYFMIFEMLSSTTPGKFLFGRQVTLDNGEPVDASAAILRNLFRPLDVVLGYPLLALTRRKQRLGDLVADTLVIKKRNNRNAKVSLACLAMVLIAFGYLASHNPNRGWFRFQMQILMGRAKGVGPLTAPPTTPAVQKPVLAPSTPPPVSAPTPPATSAPPKAEAPKAPAVPAPASPQTPKASEEVKPQTTSATLKITEFYLSSGPEPSQIRSDGVFHRGDLIFAFFKLAGFQRSGTGNVNVIEDVQLRSPDGTLMLNKGGIVNFSQNVSADSQHILFANQFSLPSDSPMGTYTLTLILKDGVTQGQLVFDKNFTLQ
jgi:uncharacterized RDD family membrane protein YckC